MICDTCQCEYGDLSQNVGTCPECLAIIIANSVPEEPEAKFDTEEPIDCVYCGNRTYCQPDWEGDPECETCKEESDQDAFEATEDGDEPGGPVCIDCGEPVDPETMTCEPCFEKDRTPEDEDLVTKDRITFYRAGMGKVAFVVAPGWDWKDAAKEYMDEGQYWPDVWLEEERGGYTNITTEGP